MQGECMDGWICICLEGERDVCMDVCTFLNIYIDWRMSKHNSELLL